MRTLSRVPPPFLFAVSLLLGGLLQRLFPLPLVPPGLAAGAHRAGGVLVAIGILLVLRCVTLFRRYHTTLDPSGRPTALITDWPYRDVRNPIYLGFTLIGVGVAGWSGSLWMILVLVIPLAVLRQAIIPREERTLTEIFGDEYLAYRKRARRWL